jgi:signal peptidase II
MIARIGGRLALIAAIAATIGCDRVTKHLAATTLAGASSQSFLADTFRLEYAENAGGFLSLGADWPLAARTALFAVGTALLLLAVVIVAIRRRYGGWTLVGLSVFVAGGASNWVDRVAWGSVIDFINVGVGPLRTGIFNVADVAIMLGVGILLVEELRGDRGASISMGSERPPDSGGSPERDSDA